MQRLSLLHAPLAVLLIASAAVAGAQETTVLEPETTVLEPVIVQRTTRIVTPIDCTPPAYASECADFHSLLRLNFTERELGVLFGSSTAYPEYRASYDRARERYAALIRAVNEDGGVPVSYTRQIEP